MNIEFMYLVEGSMECTLEDVLIFVSGADKVPPLGFPNDPCLEFLEREYVLPTVSMCSVILTIATCYNCYEDLKAAMIPALKVLVGFKLFFLHSIYNLLSCRISHSLSSKYHHSLRSYVKALFP